MPLTLEIFNPSKNWRKRYVKTPWRPIYQQIGIPPEEVAVFDTLNNQLETQVHRIDPNNPERDVLVFWLDVSESPDLAGLYQSSVRVIVKEREREMSSGPLLCGVETDDTRQRPYLALANGKLEVKFETESAPWGAESGWYAGSVSSVLLDGKEMLDAFRGEIGFLGHDMEKRCMQIDRLRLSLPAWSSEPFMEVNLVGESYEIISMSQGPVRASVCVASHPFAYRYQDSPGGEWHTLACRLYRVISLYREADYIVEELFVSGPDTKGADIYFTARYFMYMDFGLDEYPVEFFRIRDWFAIACRSAPFQSFGFATDAHTGPVFNPHPDFHDSNNSHKSFSFELDRAPSATCVHLFVRCNLESIQHRTGAAWHDLVFRPPWAQIVSQDQPLQQPFRGVES